MRLRVPELLDERGWTAYEMSKRSGGRITMSAAYRLARGEFGEVSATMLDALADVFGLSERDLGQLLTRRNAP